MRMRKTLHRLWGASYSLRRLLHETLEAIPQRPFKILSVTSERINFTPKLYMA